MAGLMVASGVSEDVVVKDKVHSSDMVTESDKEYVSEAEASFESLNVISLDSVVEISEEAEGEAE